MIFPFTKHWKNKKHVPNHQPDQLLRFTMIITNHDCSPGTFLRCSSSLFALQRLGAKLLGLRKSSNIRSSGVSSAQARHGKPWTNGLHHRGHGCFWLNFHNHHSNACKINVIISILDLWWLLLSKITCIAGLMNLKQHTAWQCQYCLAVPVSVVSWVEVTVLHCGSSNHHLKLTTLRFHDCYINELENGHRNSGFTHWTCWFP